MAREVGWLAKWFWPLHLTDPLSSTHLQVTCRTRGSLVLLLSPARSALVEKDNDVHAKSFKKTPFRLRTNIILFQCRYSSLGGQSCYYLSALYERENLSGSLIIHLLIQKLILIVTSKIP